MTHNTPKDPSQSHDSVIADIFQNLAKAEENTASGNEPQASTVDLIGASLLQAELDAAKAQIATLQDQALRAKAEADNARRRAQEDVQKAHKYGLENFAESLLPVKDTLELGLANSSQSEAALREGVEATLKLLVNAFEKHKLLEINPPLGTKFDPTFHNGISMIASEHPSQTVAMVLQKGYQIADRVLRPALVAVSSGQS